ncbi:STAS/SEC14 domain-containing protein [Kiritimatiellota bacterium B12222]|nr:STAS/SEC14 domain-containing protein [Kiritimatiellota bacterium B12222]
MITKLAESEGATLGLEVSGKIDLIEEKKWIGIVETLIQEHDRINILVVRGGKLGYEFKAAYEDLKWTFKHLKHIHKIAIVSESNVLAALVAMDSPFAQTVGISEKHFKTSNLQDAWQWVNA